MINAEQQITDVPYAEGHKLGAALRLLVSDSVVYVIGAGLLGLGSFVLVPLYTRILRPDEFGVYALVDVAILILGVVTQLKLDVAYLKSFSDLDASRHRDLLSSVLVAGGSSAALGGAILFLVMASPMGGRIFHTADRGFAWSLLPIVVLENLQGLLLSDLRVRRRAVAYCTSTLVRLLAIVAASVWLLSVRHLGLYGLFVGRMLGDAVGVVPLIFFCRKAISLRFDWLLLRPMVRFGAPLVWSALMMMSLDATGRYVLTQSRSLQEVGYLGAAIKISSVFQLLVAQPFAIAWGGLMFQIVKWPHARAIYSKIFTYVLVLSLVLGLCVTTFTPQLFRIFATRAYAPAMAVFPWIILVRALSLMEYPAAISIYLVARTHWFALIYSSGLAVNIAGNILLDRRYGLWGVAWAWLIGWLVIVVLMRAVGQRLYRLHSDWRLWALAVVPWVLFLSCFPSGLSRLTISLATQLEITLGLAIVFGTLIARDFRSVYRGWGYAEAGQP